MGAITRVSIIVVSLLALTLAPAALAEDQGEKFGFQAEVSKLLDIIINALYTNRNIFLREVISNASDALDKIRFLYLTNPKEPKNDAGEEPKMDIRIRVDKENRLLTITDGGVGMTRQDLVNNLGSLGTSGTKNFVEKLKESNDANFIGQFGVGFYSVFLVADEVKVSSKNDDSANQWVWKSKADGEFFVYEDPRGNSLGRGTELELTIKKDAEEYLDTDKIQEIATKYSEFIQFPIYVQTSKTEKVPKKKEETEPEKKEDDEEGEVKDEEEGKDEEPEMEEVTTYDWKLVNENKPIWQRKADDITEEEYNSFYKAISKDYEDPLYHAHFSAEGEVEFKAILFLPARAPYQMFDMNKEQSTNIRLYVRRVFITDEFKDLMPRYLSFIKGVVDSDDLPLNVSRELLQESRILKIIKKKLIRKALAMLKELAEEDEEKGDDDSEEGEKDVEKKEEKEEDEKKEKKEAKYPKFWEEFGRNLRLGLIEDGTNRSRLTKLLRYRTSKSDDKLASLDDYVNRMPEKQKGIYYIVGESMEKLKQHPALEDALKRNVEVIYMVDAIDEYVVGHLTDYSGHKLVNIAKEAPKFDDDDERAKKIDTKRKEAYQPLCDWFKDTLGEKVQKVVLTKRKTDQPMIVSSPTHGLTANMARIMQGQALGEKSMMGQQEVKRIVELNHLHPIIDEINKRAKVDKDDTAAKDSAQVLFEMSSLQAGFGIDDTTALAGRMGRMLRSGLDIDANAGLVEEEEYEIEEEEEDEKEEKEDEPEEVGKDEL
eukprot:TRINITY_DN2896_c0_g2_i1.p2 TRINITY_DN2896_c0_g2~~TRINITY_DN2896_c0_g2_i1.p2  ORF type:complete len:769 (+),score=403.23 TRINITY_DN2896_c0_g2_i1:85-2391(+)